METERPSGFRLGLLCGIAHSALMVLSFPPFGLDLLALVVIVPLIVASRPDSKVLRTMTGVWFGSLLAWGYLHRWVWTNEVTYPGFLGMTAYLAVYPALFVGALARVRRRSRLALWFTAPILWAMFEFVRAHIVFHGYPWYLVGHSLAGRVLIASYAPIVGAYGVSAMVAWLNTCIALALSRVARRPRLRMAPKWIGGVVAVVVVLLGGLLLHVRTGRLLLEDSKAGGVIRVAVVQTDVPQSNKRFSTPEERVDQMLFLLGASERAAGAEERPDVIVWPETMYPWTLGISVDSIAEQERLGLTRVEWYYELLAMQSRIGVAIIVGSVSYDGLRLSFREDGKLGDVSWDGHFNSAFLIDDGETRPERYDKMFLTPFGEVMPYISAWPWLESKLMGIGAGGMSFDLDAGRTATTLPVETDHGTVEVATPICFEATMPAVCRRLVFDGVERRAGLMVNLTNDGWFGDARGVRECHLLLARWRCMELATPMVRAANTGISAAIDASGRVTRWGPDDLEPGGRADRRAGVMTAGVVAGVRGATVYARTGDWPMWIVMLAGLALIGAAFRREKTDPTAKVDA